MKKWIAINLLLLATAVLLGMQLRKSILQFGTENSLTKIQPTGDLKGKLLQEKLPAGMSPPKIYNPAEFSIISDKNLFSDSRSKEEKVDNTAPPETPPLAQKPILVGITITEAERKASIIDVTAPADQQNRRESIRKIGDVYQGYTITEIAPDRIILESGTRKEVIPLREGTKRGSGGKTPIISTRVVPFGAGGTTGGATVSVSTSSSPGAPPVVTPARTVVSPVGTTTQTSPAQRGGVTQAAAPARVTLPAESVQEGQPATPPATRVIRTPFGDIVRPVNR
jgi:hypothetical protein